MKSKKFFCLVLFSIISLCAQTWVYKPFDEAMQRAKFPRAFTMTEPIVGIDGDQLYGFFKDLHEKYNPRHFVKEIQGDVYRVPRTIHQIWLGSPVPKALKSFAESWKKMHPDWQYILWTDKEVEEFGLVNKHFYDATDNYGAKSDIARWEIVYKMGGVYIDMDFECLQPLDMFNKVYDFYTAIQPLDTQFIQLGAALFGACPGHPLLKHCIETIKDDWWRKGAPQKTGPVHFTRSFFACAGKSGRRDIAFAPYYFYPLGCMQRVVEDAVEYQLRRWVEQGAIAIHWWSKSWMPKAYRPHVFKSINNESSTANWNS